ncbi:hypothetical protein E2P81_ATG10067 [Venturia nashicola]|uniref:Uncharacterized protein n=1 Tax=Venturia nashicola TaxID=86259 RepID=A0A4Z1NCV4_9PEZI|nr:hypothetical protein E6O75_ATG10286 [Venturia nashicola]TLD18245.1 hypothetical protein E2P81_ATG10067 [Venturia nashicola]
MKLSSALATAFLYMAATVSADNLCKPTGGNNPGWCINENDGYQTMCRKGSPCMEWRHPCTIQAKFIEGICRTSVRQSSSNFPGLLQVDYEREQVDNEKRPREQNLHSRETNLPVSSDAVSCIMSLPHCAKPQKSFHLYGFLTPLAQISAVLDS